MFGNMMYYGGAILLLIHVHEGFAWPRTFLSPVSVSKFLINTHIYWKRNKKGQNKLLFSLPFFFFQGAVPFLVVATSGTTVLGAFDPLDDIADICEKHKLWLHVDVS